MHRAVSNKLTRKDEPSMSLENFAFMADDMIVWNDNERVLTIYSACVGHRQKAHPCTFWYQVIKSGPFFGTSGILV